MGASWLDVLALLELDLVVNIWGLNPLVRRETGATNAFNNRAFKGGESLQWEHVVIPQLEL